MAPPFAGSPTSSSSSELDPASRSGSGDLGRLHRRSRRSCAAAVSRVAGRRRVALLRRRRGEHEVLAARTNHPRQREDLQVAWRWSSPDNDIVKANPTARPGGYQDTPIMVNGVLYTTTSLGVYAAIDPATGRTLWQYDPEIWKSGRPPNLGFTHRGSRTGPTARASGSSAARTTRISSRSTPRPGSPIPTFGERRPAWTSSRACRTPSACATTRSTHAGRRQERHHRRRRTSPTARW